MKHKCKNCGRFERGNGCTACYPPAKCSGNLEIECEDFITPADEEKGKKSYSKSTKTKQGANEMKIYLHPIIDWTSEDVWEYIHQYQVPYCSLYDEGFKRIGCVMCPFHGPKGMKRDAKRWPKIAAMYKWACNRAYEKAIADGLERANNWVSGDQMYDWWINGKSKEKLDPDQTVIFE